MSGKVPMFFVLSLLSSLWVDELGYDTHRALLFRVSK